MILKRLLILSIIIFSSSACSLVPAKLNTSKLIGNPDTINHIRMLDGNTGETVVFGPGEDTQAVLDFIKSLNGTYDPDLGVSAGYLYWIAGYRDGEEVFRLTFGSSIVKIDRKRYKLDRDVSSELDKLFNMASYGKLLTMAMDDLADKRDISIDEITPVSVKTYFFSEESPLFQDNKLIFESVKSPFGHTLYHGYILVLSVYGYTITYHGSGDRVVEVSD